MKTGHLRTTLALLLLLAMAAGGASLLSGCGGARSGDERTMEAAWERIREQYEEEHYLAVTERLEIFLINYAGSALADSAQYLLAQSHFEMKEYIIAASEYQKLVAQYPQSPLVEEAEYRMGLSYYELSPRYSLDQKYTHRAIETFQLFIEDFPQSELVEKAENAIKELRLKLARKAYSSGVLYMRMSEFESARIYFREVLDNYYDTPYAPRALYNTARSYLEGEEYEEAVEEYLEFLRRYGDHRLEGDALGELNEAREKLAEGDQPGWWVKLLPWLGQDPDSTRGAAAGEQR